MILFDMLVAIIVLVTANLVCRTLLLWWRHREHRRKPLDIP